MPSEAPSQAELHGRVTYLERMALPPQSRVNVSLSDISMADAPAQVLAEVTLHPQGQVPIPFVLSYDPSQIQPNHRYAVRAEIRGDDGRLLWTTTQQYAVLTQGATQDQVEILLERVASAPADPSVRLPRTQVFDCDNLRVVAHFETQEAVDLYLPDQALELAHVPAASGAKYQAGNNLFWSKGNDAEIEIAGKALQNCRNNPTRAPWEDARLRGISVRAVGEEPFWSLEIVPEKSIKFVPNIGALPIWMPVPRVEKAEGMRRYRVQNQDHDLTIELHETRCTDTMIGESHPLSAQIKLDGKSFQGCGEFLGATPSQD